MRRQRTLGVMARCWRHGGRVTDYLSVLLALGLVGPGSASTLQFDSFSVSAFIEPPSTTGFP